MGACSSNDTSVCCGRPLAAYPVYRAEGDRLLFSGEPVARWDGARHTLGQVHDDAHAVPMRVVFGAACGLAGAPASGTRIVACVRLADEPCHALVLVRSGRRPFLYEVRDATPGRPPRPSMRLARRHLLFRFRRANRRERERGRGRRGAPDPFPRLLNRWYPRLPRRSRCLVCAHRMVGVRLQCGHGGLCRHCARLLDRCHLCRAPIQQRFLDRSSAENVDPTDTAWWAAHTATLAVDAADEAEQRRLRNLWLENYDNNPPPPAAPRPVPENRQMPRDNRGGPDVNALGGAFRVPLGANPTAEMIASLPGQRADRTRRDWVTRSVSHELNENLRVFHGITNQSRRRSLRQYILYQMRSQVYNQLELRAADVDEDTGHIILRTLADEWDDEQENNELFDEAIAREESNDFVRRFGVYLDDSSVYTDDDAPDPDWASDEDA